jgi:carbon-monoxide dehydrogenase large subunit
MNILPGNMRFGAGQPVKRLEDQRLLTGRGQFIDDKPDDGALWLHVLRSPHAHARIVSVDASTAASMPEIVAVYTGAALVADDIGTLPTLMLFARPDGSPMTVAPRRLLAHEFVRFAGEAVAAPCRANGSGGYRRGIRSAPGGHRSARRDKAGRAHCLEGGAR